MKKVFNTNPLIVQALTSPQYASKKKGTGHHEAFNGPGTDVLHTMLSEYVQLKLKIRDYWWYYVSKAMANENLSTVFDSLATEYELEIRLHEDLPEKTIVRIKAQTIKALAFVTASTQDNKELYRSILNIVTDTVKEKETAHLKFLKILDKDGKGKEDEEWMKEEFKKVLLVGTDASLNSGTTYKLTLSYEDIREYAIMQSFFEARELVCQKWLDAYARQKQIS
jgi:hypothetical protein